MNVLSLFSGMGAFERALTNLQIPYNLVAFSEKDEKVAKTYSVIHSINPNLNLGDITQAKASSISKSVNLITYGFPCQDISCSGKQAGLYKAGKKTRSGLFFDALCFIDMLKPEVAIAENVKNLTTPKFREEFTTILNSLTTVGYNNYWFVLNAVDFDIPQNRERLFIVSIRKDVDNGRFVPPTPLQHRNNSLLRFVEQNVPSNYWLDTVGKPVKYIKDKMQCTVTAAAMRGRPDDTGKNVQRFEISDRPYVNTITTVEKDCLLYFGRNDKGAPRIRRLMGIEAFKLMGFTTMDYNRANQYNSERTLYKQAGNSIVVSVAEAVLQSVRNTGII